MGARLPHGPSRPATLYEELVAVLGREAADRLTQALGGRQIYVPAAPGPAHPLTAAIGSVAAATLAEFYAGTHFTVPISPAKRAEVLALAAKGVKPNAIGPLVRCSRSYVYKVLAEDRDGGVPPPMPLFD